MKRRDLLQQAGAMMALAGGGISSSGCVSQWLGIKQFALEKLSAAQALTLLREIEDKIQNQTFQTNDPRFATPQATKKIAMLKEILSTMWNMSAYKDLPPAARQDPALKQHFASKMGRMGELCLEATTYLESMPQAERNSLQTALKSNKELRQLRSQMMQESARFGVYNERQKHMGYVWDHVTWRLEHQNPSLLFNEVISKVDKIALQHGVTPDMRRQFVQQKQSWLTQAHPTKGTRSTSTPTAIAQGKVPAAGLPSVHPGRGTACNDDDGSYNIPQQRQSVLPTVGGIIMGVAALQGIVGGVMVGVGSTAGAGVVTIGAILLITAGLALIAGLITLLIGVGRNSNR